MGELLRRRSVPSPRGVRNTFGRIVHGSGWLAGAGLLVLLISTNCTVVSTPLCSSDFECGAPDQVCDQNKCIVGCRGPEQCAVGETCEPHPGIPLGSAAGQCIANVCNDSESRSEEHTSLQSPEYLVCRLLLEIGRASCRERV